MEDKKKGPFGITELQNLAGTQLAKHRRETGSQETVTMAVTKAGEVLFSDSLQAAAAFGRADDVVAVFRSPANAPHQVYIQKLVKGYQLELDFESLPEIQSRTVFEDEIKKMFPDAASSSEKKQPDAASSSEKKQAEKQAEKKKAE